MEPSPTGAAICSVIAAVCSLVITVPARWSPMVVPVGACRAVGDSDSVVLRMPVRGGVGARVRSMALDVCISAGSCQATSVFAASPAPKRPQSTTARHVVCGSPVHASPSPCLQGIRHLCRIPSVSAPWIGCFARFVGRKQTPALARYVVGDQRERSILNGSLQQEGGQVAHGATFARADLAKSVVDRLGHGDGEPLWLEKGVAPCGLSR